MEDGGCIQIECAVCRESLDSPESLCDHMKDVHRTDRPVRTMHFANKEEFQLWLCRVEASRAAESGVVAGTSEDIADNNNGEYYLLCGRSPTPTVKRRKFNRRKEDALNNNSFHIDQLSSKVMCTAFVHVTESTDGTFSARFCLDHNQHSPLVRRKRHVKERNSLKRDCCSLSEDEYCDVEKDILMNPIDLFPVREIMENIDRTITSIGIPNNSRSLDIQISELREFDLSSANTHIAQRLDSTADRLKALTKVLADLAVDINACEESRICSVAV